MVHARNSGSPSFHSPDALSMNRGVDATRNLATATPDDVNFSSGSSVRLPTTVMVVSPAMALLLAGNSVAVRLSQRCDKNREVEDLADFRPDDLGTQHRLVEPELT